MLFDLDANAWVTIIIQAVALVVGLIGALWAYTKFVLERGILPPAQFTIEAAATGSSAGAILVEALLHLKNLGSTTLVAHNIRLDVLYLKKSEQLAVFGDPGDPRFGRVCFAHSLREEIGSSIGPAVHSEVRSPEVVSLSNEAAGGRFITQVPREERGFLLLGHKTFVQPGVDQTYTFVTSLPESSCYLLVWASFEYARTPHRMQDAILTISRHLGLIQYILQDATEPHTVERVFRIADPS